MAADNGRSGMQRDNITRASPRLTGLKQDFKQRIQPSLPLCRGAAAQGQISKTKIEVNTNRCRTGLRRLIGIGCYLTARASSLPLRALASSYHSFNRI
jgi:hypothetical protein